MIVFDKAGKRFGNVEAVKDFSLTIQDEEILGLLGPNGAGKDYSNAYDGYRVPAHQWID